MLYSPSLVLSASHRHIASLSSCRCLNILFRTFPTPSHPILSVVGHVQSVASRLKHGIPRQTKLLFLTLVFSCFEKLVGWNRWTRFGWIIGCRNRLGSTHTNDTCTCTCTYQYLHVQVRQVDLTGSRNPTADSEIFQIPQDKKFLRRMSSKCEEESRRRLRLK